MQTDELSVVLPSSTTSGLSLSLHPLPILNISEHLTRLRLRTQSSLPFVLGTLLGTQNGREVDIVNTFELAVEDGGKIDHGFLTARREQYKQVFPSLELIGWYSVAQYPTSRHIAVHEQFTPYLSTPLLLLLNPSKSTTAGVDVTAQTLPFKAYEPTLEIRDRKSRSVYIEAPFNVATGEAERIAVDWTARGGEGGTSLESHLQTQRAAIKMLHDRILVLVQYVTDVIAGSTAKDHQTLRALSALIASLPASENDAFRGEFEQEYEDVQLTAYLASLTRSTNALNELMDKHLVLHGGGDRGLGGRRPGPRGARLGGVGIMGMGGGMGDW